MLNPMLRRILEVLPKALLTGLALGVLQYVIGLSRPLWVSMAINMIFSTVMWCGFHGLHDLYEPRPGGEPKREALRCMLIVSLLYIGLLLICTTLVKAVTGLNLLRHVEVAAITFCAGFAVTNFIIAMHTLVGGLESERARLQAEARAGFLALQAQLQPHTLFNALNAIAALIPEDPAKAEAATEGLSRLLRRIMSALEQESWTLQEEFSVLEDLLALERLRFGDRLQTTLSLDPAEATRRISPLLLVPLVENALKHGFRPKVGPCHLAVLSVPGGVRVEDDGMGRDAAAPEGVGLRTVRERLEAVGGALAWPPVAQGCAVELRFGN